MTIQRDVKYPGRWIAADADYPLGGPKNRTTPTSADGSYFDKDWIADSEAFHGKLIADAGITPNNTPDTAQASQIHDAFVDAIETIAPAEESASTTVIGVSRKSTALEITAGTEDGAVFVSPKQLQDKLGSVSQLDVSSEAEAIAGTDNTTAISPLRLRQGLNAAGSAPIYAKRAWLNYDGIADVIRGSGNVSSVSNNAMGDFNVNFITPIDDVNFGLTGIAMRNSVNNTSAQAGMTVMVSGSATYGNSVTTTSVNILTKAGQIQEDARMVSITLTR
jgi:hypothetical protein